jgi:hypothetical protein
MASDKLPWWYYVGSVAARRAVPVGWLVFRLQVLLFAWSQIQADSANPAPMPLADLTRDVFAFPLAYCPASMDWLKTLAGENTLVCWLAANALCWECLVTAFLSRTCRRVLSGAAALADICWPD